MPSRGCGDSRSEDGVYLNSGGPGGNKPIDYFLKDPVLPLPDGWNAKTLANKATITEMDGAFHVVIWVGETHYPYLDDYVTESRLWGISRKVSSLLDFSKLTQASRMIMIHPKAYNPAWAEHSRPYVCLKDNLGHGIMSTHDDELNKTHHLGPCIYQVRDLIPADAGVALTAQAFAGTDRFAQENDLSFHKQDDRGYPLYHRQFTKDTMYVYSATGQAATLEPGIWGVFPIDNIALICSKNGELGPKTSRAKAELDQLQGDIPYIVTPE